MNGMELKAVIGLDSSQFDSGLDKAEKNFSSFGSKLGSGLKTAGKVAVGAITAVSTAVIGLGTAFVKSAAQTAKFADTIDKESQKLGISAKAYQEWDFILQHTGGSIENLKPAFKTLSKEIVNNSEAFKQLGISQQELLNSSKEEVFSKVITELQKMPDGVERTRLATQLLGKSSVELGALLNTSAEDTEKMREEIHKLGGVMSDEAVKAGAKFQDSLLNVKTALKGLKNNLMSNFLPAMSTVMDGLAELFSGKEGGTSKIEQGIKELGEKLNEELPKFIKILETIFKSLLANLPSFFQTIAEMLPSLFSQLLPVVIDAIVGLADAAVKALPSIVDIIAQNIDKLVDGFFKVVKTIINILPKLIPSLVKLAVGIIKALAQGFRDNAKEIVSGIIEVVMAITTALIENLPTILEAVLEIIIGISEAIMENIDKVLEVVVKVVETVINLLIEAAPQLAEATVKLLIAIFTVVVPKLLEMVGQLFVKLIEGIAKGIVEVAKYIGHQISQGIQSLQAKGREMWESFGNTLTNAIGGFKEKIQNFWNNIKKKFTDVFEGMVEIGENFVKGLWKGISSFGGWLYDKVVGFCRKWIIVPVEKLFGISSPSKRFAQIGQYLIQGLELGVNGESRSAFNGMKKFGDGIISALEDVLDIHSPSRVAKKDGLMFAQGFSDGAINGLDSAYDKIEDKVEERGKELSEMSWRDTVDSVDTLTTRTQMALNPLKKYDSGMRFAQKNQSTGTYMGGRGLNVLEDAINPLNAGVTATRAMSGVAGTMGLLNQLTGNVKRASSSGSTSGFGGGSGLGGGSGSGGSGGEGGYSSGKIDELLDMLRELLMKDITFESDLMLDNTRIGAVITSINADNTIRSGGYY